ncbi:unnamed protein product [Albugo candida]|uniref:Uncharacterized protein n=1 Tax=Albugo candida TaxID=65357 RepID=A0A024GLW0_9STRA|nr:unnamed protein product [Albugo candida]|eukprot:CCI47322.1 unnamed protein product [Albugo candida]
MKQKVLRSVRSSSRFSEQWLDDVLRYMQHDTVPITAVIVNYINRQYFIYQPASIYFVIQFYRAFSRIRGLIQLDLTLHDQQPQSNAYNNLDETNSFDEERQRTN